MCLWREFVRFSSVKDYGLQSTHRFLDGQAWRKEQLFLDDPLAVRKIHGKYPEFFRSCIGQHNCYGIAVYNFTYICCNRAQDLPQVKARRDSGGQIEEQLQAVVLLW